MHTKNVQDSSQAVTDALNNLLQHIRDGARIRPGGPFDTVCDDILNATDKLYNSMGNAGEMVKQAKVLAQVRNCFLSKEYQFARHNSLYIFLSF